MICLSAYLLIYNILYLSVNGKIRYYGLLQALGMTRKQILQFIKKQMLLISADGIAAGIVLGILTSLVLTPYVMDILGIRKPVGTAADISPVEAVKYRGLGNARPGSRKVRKKNCSGT